MKEKFYDNKELNKLIVVRKPIFESSNFYLNKIKKIYKNKKAGFSGTLDPFAKGCLIVAFGKYAKLFNFFSKTPKTYNAVAWLGVKSSSLDIENIQSIEILNKLDEDKIKDALNSLVGEFEYIPPIFSAKRINGQRAYELARNNKEVNLSKTKMVVYKTKFINYNHPYIAFEVEVSEGAYIRSFAQILFDKLKTFGTLCYLERLNEGKFYFENQKDLNPLDYIDLANNTYLGDTKWLEDGKKINVKYLEKKENGKYIIITKNFFTLVEIVNNEVKYILNKVPKNETNY